MIKNGRVLSNRGSEEFFFIDWIPQVQNSTCENPSHNVYKNESGKEESENRKKWADLKMKEKKHYSPDRTKYWITVLCLVQQHIKYCSCIKIALVVKW